jgi:hypothetical protein
MIHPCKVSVTGCTHPAIAAKKRNLNLTRRGRRKFTGKRFINMLSVLSTLLSVVSSQAPAALEVMPLRQARDTFGFYS